VELVVRLDVRQRLLHMAKDHTNHIIEIMGNPPGKTSD